ncbi:MAG TPA: hypothetical protein VMB50_17980 [Myxococcales bacterium]|nr:hypothetical protein [Myxococcales bacterium]
MNRVAWALALPLLMLGPLALAQADGGAASPTRDIPDGGPVPLPAFPDAGSRGPQAALPSPAFTQDRQFTNARLWRLDPGRITVEQSWSGAWGVPRALAGAANQNDQLLQTAVAIGLLPHLELDLSGNVDLDQAASGDYQISPTGLTGVAAEVRIAIGRYWGQIWGNPTIDAELWGRISEPTRLEGRVLLGGELFTPRLLGTLNLMFARNSFHDDATGIDYEIKADLGANCEVVRDILRLGGEATVGWDSHDTVDAEDNTLLHPDVQLGPAILLTEPHRRFKLLAAFLWGLADWDPPWETEIVAGTTF